MIPNYLLFSTWGIRANNFRQLDRTQCRSITYSHGQKYRHPLVNMIKECCENESALLMLLIFYFKNSQKSNLSLDNKNLKWGGNIIMK